MIYLRVAKRNYGHVLVLNSELQSNSADLALRSNVCLGVYIMHSEYGSTEECLFMHLCVGV